MSKVEHLDNQTKIFLYNTFGKASTCEHCDNKKRKHFVWTVKKKHKCDNNRTSYLQLCRSCIQHYWKGVERKWATDKVYRKMCEQNTKLKRMTPAEKEKAKLVRLRNRGCQIFFPHKIMKRYFKPNNVAKRWLDNVTNS